MNVKKAHRLTAAAVCAALLSQMLPAAALARPHGTRPFPLSPYNIKNRTQDFRLRDGRRVSVTRYGMATVYSKAGKPVESRWLPASVVPNAMAGSDDYAVQIDALAKYLMRPANPAPYAADHVIVVFNDGAAPAVDSQTTPKQVLDSMRSAKSAQGRTTLAPRYTNDSAINSAFARLGVAKVNRLFASFDRSRLSSLRTTAQSRMQRPLLNIANAYSISLTAGTPADAVRALRGLPGITYVSPDWRVAPLAPIAHSIPKAVRRELESIDPRTVREGMALRTQSAAGDSYTTSVPSNYSEATSYQSFMDASGIDATTAYQEVVEQFHQLPGTGEIVTNVSIGDIYSSEDSNGVFSGANPCPTMVGYYGAVTHMIGGQRYLDWPGMPLIPAYAADQNGHIDPKYTACTAGSISEFALDFSMMAPLPDDRQRPEERGFKAIGDLVGIAPGAQYRLVVPADNAGYDAFSNLGALLSSLDATFLAAAQQTPAPNVITASLGPNFDGYGFSSRFMEDDPLSQAVIASIVNGMNIVVCISSGDGTRSFTPAAIGPSGGSTATERASDVSQTTSLNDIAFSTVPSMVLDSGAIDVGGTTLNDVFSAPPSDPRYASLANTLAFPETRYNGMQALSSGFGSRVDISAPSDNIMALDKPLNSLYDTMDPSITGGTSASAPEVAAAAAVALQVARLTGHPFPNARAVRDFLVQTATPVAQPAITDRPLNVGPQLNVRQAVETLLANAGIHLNPRVERVAVAQRRNLAPTLDTVFFTATSPSNIKLDGIDYGYGDGPDGSGFTDWITIAPDWQAIPANATFSLYVQGHADKPIATTRYARLLPAQILSAAGCAVPSRSACSVKLVYRAGVGLHMAAQATFDLTLGASDGTSVVGYAPIVPPVVTGDSFTIDYDVSKVRHMQNPMLVITEPGRYNFGFSGPLHAGYVQPLTSLKGTVTVPVSALQGGGMYGATIASYDPGSAQGEWYTDFAQFLVQQGSAARPPAPTLQIPASNEAPGHFLEMPLGSSVSVSWDVSNVPNASGAVLEVSAPGPSLALLWNTFNNPNGSIPDDNGLDTGSVKTIQLPGSKGQMIFSAADLGLHSTMMHLIRVIPMRGSIPAGEAGESSSIVMDGITPALTGLLDHSLSRNSGGFGIDPNGSGGFMISNLDYGSSTQSSLEHIDLASGTTTEVAAGFSYAGWGVPGGGLFDGTALFNQRAALSSDTNSITLTAPVNGGKAAISQFTGLPAASDVVFQTSFNPNSSRGAMLFFDGAQQVNTSSPVSLQLMSFDTAGGRPGPAFSTPLTWNETPYGGGNSTLFLFAADMALNKAVTVWQPWNDFVDAPTVDIWDLGTGAATEFKSIAAGSTDAVAVDETTHVAMTTSVADLGLVLLNLQRGTEQKTFLPDVPAWQGIGLYGGWAENVPEFIAADPVNHLFLAYSALGPGVADGDYNATGALYVYDEQGNLLKTITGWAWASDPYLISDVSNNSANFLQVNGVTRKAYLMTPGQLAVIDY
jgi:hypothetical protein